MQDECGRNNYRIRRAVFSHVPQRLWAFLRDIQNVRSKDSCAIMWRTVNMFWEVSLMVKEERGWTYTIYAWVTALLSEQFEVSERWAISSQMRTECPLASWPALLRFILAAGLGFTVGGAPVPTHTPPHYSRYSRGRHGGFWEYFRVLHTQRHPGGQRFQRRVFRMVGAFFPGTTGPCSYRVV